MYVDTLRLDFSFLSVGIYTVPHAYFSRGQLERSTEDITYTQAPISTITQRLQLALSLERGESSGVDFSGRSHRLIDE